MIAKRSLPDAWLDDLGERQVILKGRGGVGKTVIILQMAYRAYELRQLRSLVLTFNKALVADLRRTMALLGVPRGVGGGGIGVETVHSFFGRLMLGLGVINSYDGFLEGYDGHKATLLNYLESGAISPGDLDALRQRQPSDFDWDLVLVDEGQDWPRDEVAILRAVFGPDRLTVSDGVDQFVRESVADWSTGVGKSSLRARRLTRCMRMKANLAAFVGDMAVHLGLEGWDLEPNSEASGGRVIIVEGDLASDPAMIKRLCAEARDLGNYPVDMLACVPPSMVDPSGPDQLCRPASQFVKAGGEVWDGTSRDIREHFPTHRDQLRFVQYDSCRGLEGWTTINYELDGLWEYKRRQWLVERHTVDDLYQTADEMARAHASRWVMIPLTRSIDTLVINVGLQQSSFKEALLKTSAMRGDFVQWLRVPAQAEPAPQTFGSPP
nr:AAA family ATPase [Propylenella binzhouense]